MLVANVKIEKPLKYQRRLGLALIMDIHSLFYSLMCCCHASVEILLTFTFLNMKTDCLWKKG